MDTPDAQAQVRTLAERAVEAHINNLPELEDWLEEQGEDRDSPILVGGYMDEKNELHQWHWYLPDQSRLTFDGEEYPFSPRVVDP